MNAYLQQPCLFENRLYFATDDDIWLHHLDQKLTQRLTNSQGVSKLPKVSPEGQWLSYISQDEASSDLYMIPALGGEKVRLTYTGAVNYHHWMDEDYLMFGSTAKTPWREPLLYKLNIHTLEYTQMLKAPASCLYTADNGQSILGKNLGDPARWKRYKGGTAGTIWLSQKGSGHYKQVFKNLSSNLSNPLIYKNKLYFISDHEGVGNIYRSNLNGKNIQRITHQEEYYVRNFQFWYDRFVYQCAGDIYLLDIKRQEETLLDISVPTVATQAQERMIHAECNLDSFDLHEDNNEVLVNTRGQIFTMPPWGGSPVRLGDNNSSSRYRLPRYLDSETIIVSKQSEEKEEHLVTINTLNFKEKLLLENSNIRKPLQMIPCPNKNYVAILNNRTELVLIDLKNKSVKIIDNVNIGSSHISWSPKGSFLVFTKADPINRINQTLMIYEVKSNNLKVLIPSFNFDSSPSFSSCGKYLFFIGVREYQPVMNNTHFDFSFPEASKIYCLNLQKNMSSPLDLFLGIEKDENGDNGNKDKKSKKTNKSQKEHIDFDNLENYITTLPMELGIYTKLIAVDECRILYVKEDQYNFDPFADGSGWDSSPSNCLFSYSFKDKREEKYCEEFYSGRLSSNKKFLLYYCEDGLRLHATDSKPNDEEGFNKKDGWIDLERIKVKLNPREEWKQIYQEAWLLQREHFWTEDMSRIDWENIYMRYLPLLSKVQTRSEFSDLIWEMQGELGTSHCYEMGGDYNRRPTWGSMGHLGADYKFNQQDQSFEIIKLYKGMSWLTEQSSPLLACGKELKVGDKIIGLNGLRFQEYNDFQKSLVGMSRQMVTLEVIRKSNKKAESVSVKTLASEKNLRYRDWVEKNREYVHQKSGDKVGYIHIPDMWVMGIGEFYRYYLKEHSYEALIVDVRYNGGGNVSALILSVLAKKIIGFCESRYFGHYTYPELAPRGPIVCLTNEHAGSDGDIFSHSFKLMRLGKLIGKRTWGGVVGIWPRFGLKDGTYTSQPEFSHWFEDVEWNVENYGTEPDIEVDILPQDHEDEIDTQLDRGIKEVLADLKKFKVLDPKKLKNRPDFSAPKLPKN